MMDRNGYAPSIMLTEPGMCFTCRRTGDTVRHEVFFGPNRRISKEHGLWVNICPACHDIVHLKPDDGRMDRWLKKMTFEVYVKEHGRQEFRDLIGRYYD